MTMAIDSTLLPEAKKKITDFVGPYVIFFKKREKPIQFTI